MTKFKFYHIADRYIAFLHSGDSRVQMSKGQRRPYIGIVLQINGLNYYVPLESPKPNHVNIRGGGPVLKIDDGRLGIMGFNNMIPVPDNALIDFDIDKVEDNNYRMLLYNQLHFCNRNRDLILHRASTTYRKATEGNNAFYNRVCCDFEELESMSRRYDPYYRKNHNRH